LGFKRRLEGDEMDEVAPAPLNAGNLPTRGESTKKNRYTHRRKKSGGKDAKNGCRDRINRKGTSAYPTEEKKEGKQQKTR